MSTKNATKPKAVKKPAPAPKAKDLPAKKDAKGGRMVSGYNHNETLVCA